MSRAKRYLEALSEAMGLDGVINNDVKRLGSVLMAMAEKYKLDMTVLDKLIIIRHTAPVVIQPEGADPLYLVGLPKEKQQQLIPAISEAFKGLLGVDVVLVEV